MAITIDAIKEAVEPENAETDVISEALDSNDDEDYSLNISAPPWIINLEED